MQESRPSSRVSKSPQECPVMPVDVMRGVLSPFLDIKDIANLASTHRYLSDEMKQSEYKKSAVWKEKLMREAHDIEQYIVELEKASFEIDYKKLFLDYCKVPVSALFQDYSRLIAKVKNKDDLLALIGTPNAVQEISKKSIACRLSEYFSLGGSSCVSKLYEMANLVVLSGFVEGLDALCPITELEWRHHQ